MLRIEHDDLSRSQVLALLEEHLRTCTNCPLRTSEAGGGVPPLNLALALIGLGRHDEAIAALERALMERAVPPGSRRFSGR
jgi:hypothetical protein